MNWYKKSGRGRYPGQSAGDEYRANSEMMSEIISDNELIEGEHVKKLKIFAKKGDWNDFNKYVQKLKDEGHSQTRINSMMTRSMHNVRL